MTEVLIAEVKLPARSMVRESSFGVAKLGKHESTLKWTKEVPTIETHTIKWDIPSLDETIYIDLTFEDKKLTDYSSVFSLPKEVIELIRNNGYEVSKEFE